LCGKCFRAKPSRTFHFLGAGPWFASFQAGAFRADLVQAHASGKAPVKNVSVELKAEQIRTKPLDLFKEAKSAVDLTQAPLIVAIGRGIKAPENIPQAEAVAKAMAPKSPRRVRFATKAGSRWNARSAARGKRSRQNCIWR